MQYAYRGEKTFATSNIYNEREIIYLEFDDIYLSLTCTYAQKPLTSYGARERERRRKKIK